MKQRVIEKLKDIETKLNTVLINRDLKPQLGSYIKEYVLNTEFRQLIIDLETDDSELGSEQGFDIKSVGE